MAINNLWSLYGKSCYDVGYYPQVQLVVHQLWPPEDTVCSIDFDIVFFHGVRKPGETEAWKNTWVEHTSAQEFWVKDWLPQDLDGNVRVLALSYDSCAIETNSEGKLEDIRDFGRNLLHSLVFRFLPTQSFVPLLCWNVSPLSLIMDMWKEVKYTMRWL
jgi:hypothetical protein